jgi:hypothetical protein
MSKILDRARQYGTITGHSVAVYEQDGLLFDGRGQLLGTPKTVKSSLAAEEKLITDDMSQARLFLKNILKNGPLAKSAIYKIAEDNNQSWPSVKTAAADLSVVSYTQKDTEVWKLQES